MDYYHVVRFAFDWRKTRESAKYFIFLWVLNLLFFLATVTVAYFLFRDLFLNLYLGNLEALTSLFLYPEIMDQMAADLFLVTLPIYALFLLLTFYVQAMMSIFALGKADIQTVRLNIQNIFYLIVLAIAVPLTALLCWFNKKLLLLPILIIILAAATFTANEAISIGSGLLGLFLLLIYLLVVLHNLIRLSMAGLLFLSQKAAVSDALHESWQLTEKKAISVALAYIAVALVVMLISFAVGFALSVLFSFPIFMFLVPEFVSAFYMAIGVSNVVLYPFQALCFAFAMVAIYKGLAAEAREKKVAA